MAKIVEAMNRLFKNIFICKSCQHRMRSEPQRIIDKKVKCRKCGKKVFRPVNKK